MALLANEFNDANYLDSDGNIVPLHGQDALLFIKENSAEGNGEATVERLQDALLTYQSLYDEYGIDPLGSGFPLDVLWREVQPIRPLLRMITLTYSTQEESVDLRNMSVDTLDSFYEDVEAKLISVMQSDQELRYPGIISKAQQLFQKVSTPFYVSHGYSRDAFDYIEFAILFLVILSVALSAPVFSERYSTGEDSILRCTLFGRGKLVRTTVLAELTVVTAMYFVGIGLHLVISDMMFGFDTLKESVQTLYTVYSLPKKEWLEDTVIQAIKEFLDEPGTVDAVIELVMDLQGRDSLSLPAFEKQLSETNAAIDNLLNAIQQGILTKSTKERLEQLEASRDELEQKIALEKMAKPRMSEDFIRFWLKRFQHLDTTKLEHRKMLIGTFVNAIYLYDDKAVIALNYKDGTKTVNFNDMECALSQRASIPGSDLEILSPPKETVTERWLFSFAEIGSLDTADLLTEAGAAETAYKVLLNPEKPGWLHEVLQGATTVWETWEGYTGRGDAGSLNHYSPGAVCQWLFDTCAGIRVEGENHFVITPIPGGTLTHAEASYQSLYGEVKSRWEKTESGIQYSITIPSNCTAEIRLADGRTENVTAGKYQF